MVTAGYDVPGCRWLPLIGSCLLMLGSRSPASTVEQIISREQKELEVTGKHLSLGRDGHVFVMSQGYALRLNPDGTGKVGFRPSYAMWSIAADAGGAIAVACGHMDSSVRLYSPDLEERAVARGEFADSDKIGWMAPCDIGTGPSGDFYAPDQHRGRIVRYDAWGKLVAAYSLQATGEDYKWYIVRLRVVEPLARFYLGCHLGHIHAIGFDGKLLWTIPAGIEGQGQSWKDFAGDFDADDAGNIYVLRSMADAIEVRDKDGKPGGRIPLEMGDLRGTKLSLRLSSDDVFVKREHKTELFQVYDRRTGKLRRVVRAEAETARMEYGGDVWTAGQAVPFSIAVESDGQARSPNWPVLFAPYNEAGWKVLPVADGKITPPADARGLYRIRAGGGEYRLEATVEVRAPGSRGTVNILTPLNRVYWGRGEEIPVTVIVRGGEADVPGRISVSLRERTGGAEVLRLAGGDLRWDGPAAGARIPPGTTARLRPGRYLLDAAVPGMTVVPQPLVIGPGLRTRPAFHIVEGGDGARPFVECGLHDAPEEVAAHIERSRRIGTNMFIDRAGSVDVIAAPPAADAVAARLAADPRGVTPEKARVDNLNRQAIAARGASGMEEHAVLLSMDTTLPPLRDDEENPGGWMPFGRLADWQKTVKAISSALRPYPAFRGWSWACNWWYNDEYALRHIGVKKEAWPALRKSVLDSGRWDPEVVRITDAWVGIIPEVDRGLAAALEEAAPGKVHAVTGPYRQPGVIPPISMATAGEIDLFCQAEQIQMPFIAPHDVDFYRRPGKRAFGHPETFNDDGTGGMILPLMLGQAARGADGTGWEGDIPPWKLHRGGPGRPPEDPRATWPGHVSVYRAVNAILRQYGPWLTTLEPADRVAIVVSTRMMRLDWWDGTGHLGGTYFTRLYEAYNACLRAHRPASCVFGEDLRPGALKKFGAILVVGQRVELDPPLAGALAEARGAGVPVLFDGTCRPEHVSAFRPLGVAFDRAEKESALMNCDLAYRTLPEILRREAEVLAEVLGPAVAPVAAVADPEIFLAERRSGEGRFVWAIDDDLPDWEPAMMWRVGSYVAHRVPQAVPIGLGAKGRAAYDVFALRRVGDEPLADLRTLPARLYAILPGPIESIDLTAAERIEAGGDLAWELAVRGPKTSYPVRVRLIDAGGEVIEECFPVGTRGAITVPIDAGPEVTLEAVELIGGQKARRQIRVDGGIAAKRAGPAAAEETLPVERLFGPHLRDIAVAPDGSAALVNAMSWDDNYYLIDTATGAVRSQGRAGHHYAYGPRSGGGAFYVEGYDVTTPEGYHLYDLGADGHPRRRFAAYGLPQRQKLWFGSVLVDRIDAFAVPPGGRWIAAAGNLGLVVWSPDGEKLWSEDWWRTDRRMMSLLPAGEDTLITIAGRSVAAREARTGRRIWEIGLGEAGELQGCAAGAGGRTLAAWSDFRGGRTSVIRDGRLIDTIHALPDDVSIAPDGRHLAMNIRSELRWYAAGAGIEWTFRGDDWLHDVRISPDGTKIVAGSDLGTLYVLDDRGRTLLERDLVASPVARWLAGGDLLVATWMGDVARLAPDGAERWRVRVGPGGASPLAGPPVAEKVPTVRPVWGDAADANAPLTPNLLAEVHAVIRVTDDRTPPAETPLQNPVGLLTDGDPRPPERPWLTWTVIGAAESGWCGKVVLEVESPRTPLSVDAVTFVEDPDHPESWLRNMVLQVWDPVRRRWADGPPLLSDSAVHTHRFDRPIVGSRFRFFGDKSDGANPGFERSGLGGIGWPVGNIRLAEIVFRGKAIGPAGDPPGKEPR